MAVAAPQKPNIIFILADDLGYGEVGFNGQQKILTPYVDQLAREGLVLTHHYCGNAVCAPSRAVLMTGLNPGHAPVRDNNDVGEGEQIPLPANIMTLPGVLRQAGYQTAAFGKWGMGSFDSTGNPLKQGFDRFLGLTSQWQAHSHYPPAIWDNDHLVPLQNGPQGIPGHAGFPAGANPQDPQAYANFIGKDFGEDHYIQGAEAFIAQHAQQPFFLYFASPLPHVSLQIPAEDLKVYDGKFADDPPFTPKAKGSYVPNRTPHATYAAMITRLDKDVGRLMAALEKAGISQNTIIVFSGDNGATHDVGGVETKFFNSSGGLRGLKGSLYEGGVREPTVVRWPAVIKPHTRSDRLSGFEDWLVTFAEVAGAKLTAKTNGESLVPTFQGHDHPRPSPLYREFPGYGHQQAIWIENEQGRWKAVRTNMLKSLRASGQVITELYDLNQDPNETNNLALQKPDLVHQLEAQMATSRVPDARFPLAGVDPLPETANKAK
jgi:arylsulfatase A-like enzyme